MRIFTSSRHAADVGTFDAARFTATSAAACDAYVGRLNSVMKKFAALVKDGKTYPDAAVEDDQAHGLVKAPLLVARFAGQPQMEQHVRAAVATHQRGDLVANLTVAAARLLEFVVLGRGGVRDALKWGLETKGALDPDAAALLQDVVDVQDMPTVEAVGQLGRTCHLPGNWQSVMHCLLSAIGYADAVERTILAGMSLMQRRNGGCLCVGVQPMPAAAYACCVCHVSYDICVYNVLCLMRVCALGIHSSQAATVAAGRIWLVHFSRPRCGSTTCRCCSMCRVPTGAVHRLACMPFQWIGVKRPPTMHRWKRRWTR